MPPKTYDRSYFDRWYRDPRRMVLTRADLARKAAVAVAAAERILERRLRSVVDVGCGEGSWRAPLLSLRPGLSYRGLDTSDYAVRRFGRARGIAPGSFGQLGELRFDQRFDLLVCSDVLHYLEDDEIDRGLSGLSELVEGMAFLEVMTVEDDPAGDLRGFRPRPAAWYRRRFRRAGLVSCGLHCWATARAGASLNALERP